jgi:hypothetical protein
MATPTAAAAPAADAVQAAGEGGVVVEGLAAAGAAAVEEPAPR